MDLVQINNEKWFYLHQFTARLHKTFKFSALEGSMLNAPFELRFMNPLMIMHQFSAWTEYEREGYDENHFCAYLAGLIDWEPFSNVRFYALYAQNELQLPTERDRTGVLLPDSLGGQLGAEFIVPSKNGVWSGFTEVLYTTPYLYIKQNPESSLYRSRGDNLIKDEINTWVGSPFGPDSFAIKAGAAFTLPAKYSLNASYLFLAKGEHDFSIFKEDKAPSGIYTYYPYYYYQEYGGEDDDEEVYKKSRDNARWMWLCGTPYFLNQIEVEGSMSVNSKTSLEVKTVYTFIFNENHIGGKFEHGIEVDFALTYNLL